MLSTKTVGNVKQAQHYFLGHDNYYKEEDSLAKDRSGWWGRGAEKLGLSGTIDSKVFSELLMGKMPDGQQLGRKVDHEIQHRPGFDLTFSAPKSVSILAMMGGDERIFSALQRATDKTLTMIERGCAQARVTKEGVTTYENTLSLTVAKFLHDISREADPQLHVHCVVMNMTQRSDGKWRSLASQSGDYGANVTTEINGFLERVRHHKLHYGAIFRAELAYELKQLGYEIIKTGNKSFFEIAGISQKTIDTYSQRSKQIDSYMQDYGFTGAKAAAVANIKTRKAKDNINRENLEEVWQVRSEINSINAFAEAKAVVDEAIGHNPTLQTSTIDFLPTKQALNYAIAHLSETQIALKEIQLINTAMQYALGENVNIHTITQALKEFQKEGLLIALENPSDEIIFTTKQLLIYEREILSAALTKPFDAKPIAPLQKIEAYLSQQHDLTQEQKQTIKTLFSSEYRINCLEGATNTGKTYLIKPMAELAKLNGYKVTVLTPGKAESLDVKQQLRVTPQSLREWFRELFNQSQYNTVSGFIKAQEKAINLNQHSQQKGILFIDNATLISSKQIRDLIAIAEKTNQILIPIGDKKSLLSFQAGSPFTQLIEKGAQCATLTQPMREHNQAIKAAIHDTLQNNIAAAFEKIGHRVISIENKAERLNSMAAHYVGLPSKERQKTLVLMPTKAQCEELNVAIREALKKENQLARTGIEITVLLPKSFSNAQYQLAKNYEVNQVIRFNETYRSLTIQRGDYLKIQAILPKQNKVVLENIKGETIQWDPSKCGGKAGSIEVFEAKQREIVVGDKIIYKRGLKSAAIHNGESLKITAIKNNTLIGERDNQKKVVIDLKENQAMHFDYGYAITPYQKQYEKAAHILAYQSSFSRQSHQRLFYKELSQAKEHVWIYTEDKAKLLANLQKHSGDKITVLDALLREHVLPNKSNFTLKSDYLNLIEKAVARTLTQSEKALSQPSTPEKLAKEAVVYALAHLTEREAAFEHKQVLQVALKRALGDVNTAILQQAIVEAEKNGELIRGLYSSDGTRWTTREGIEIERSILQLAKQDAGKLSAMASTELIEKHIEIRQPKVEHSDAIRVICTNTDRHLLVQGYAGTGKTTMLMHVEPLLKHVDLVSKDQGHELLCLAPTNAAVKELKERGLKAQTLESFLIEQQQISAASIKYQNKRVVAVDENSMTSNKQMLELLQITQEKEIRGLYIGDRKQHFSIGAGKPHTLLENKIKTLYLTDIERQKNPVLLKAVKESYQEDFSRVFRTLGNKIIEVGKEFIDGKAIDNPLARQVAIRDDYLSRSPEKRAQTLIITLGNEDRVRQNALIREGLKAEGELYGPTCVTSVLVPRDLSETERTRASHYILGDKIRFGFAERGLTIAKGEYLTVREIQAKDNYLVLEKSNGQTMAWQPQINQRLKRVGVEVYRQEEREVMAGDLIRWTRTDKKLGLLSPELAKIEVVQKDLLLVRHMKATAMGIAPAGECLVVEMHQQKYQHWDHAYAMTGYSSQGKTVAETIVNLESYRKQLTHQPAFIVALTRAQHDTKIYTDDKEALLNSIFEHKGQKTSALETIGEWRETPPALKQKISSTHDVSRVKTTDQQLAIDYSKPSKVDSLLKPNQPLLDAKRITQMLNEQAESVAISLLGEPKERSGQQYRFGSKGGSLIVTLQGEKRGLWHDFQTGEGGNLLQLVARQHGLNIKDKTDFKKTLAYANQVLGGQSPTLTALSSASKKHEVSAQSKTKLLTPEQDRSVNYARQLAKEALPIQGTLAERYLRGHRGIALEKLPDCFRFHPGIYSKRNEAIKPALLVIANDEKGKTQAVQAIFLDEETANKANVKVQKQTWGLPSSGASVDLSKSPSKAAPVYLAEGPETGLSIYQSIPNANVKITLGTSNFKNINTQSTPKDIVLCLDNDGNNPETAKLVQMVAEKLNSQGKTVWLAMPETVGKDYNDVLKEQGSEAVRRNIENAVAYQMGSDKLASNRILKEQLNNSSDHTNMRDKEIHKTIQQAASLSQESRIRFNTINELNLPKNLAEIDAKFIEKATQTLKNTEQSHQMNTMKSEANKAKEAILNTPPSMDSSKQISHTNHRKELDKEPEL